MYIEQDVKRGGKVRKAGDKLKENPEVMAAMEDPGPVENGGTGSTSDLSAKDEGFRNSLDRRLGAEEYDRISAKGSDALDDAGRMTAAEVKAEFRNAKKNGFSGVDEGDNSIVDYFKQQKEDGVSFNAKAQNYLKKFGMEFGGGSTPAPEEDPGVEVPDTDIPEGEDPIYTPDPEVEIGIEKPDEDTIPPIGTVGPKPIETPGLGGYGFNVGGDLNQNVGNRGDITSTIGNDNTFGAGTQIGNDFSTTIGGNSAGNGGAYFGNMLSEEKQRRAASGAFASGVGSGLNLS